LAARLQTPHATLWQLCRENVLTTGSTAYYNSAHEFTSQLRDLYRNRLQMLL
jgi:hypothetical protein